jgi:tetratricopeptide (TPR) repeat protein
LFTAKSLEGANHEVEVIESGLFEFRLLFHGGAEITIRFQECSWEVLPDEYGNVGLSPEVAEEIAGIAGMAGTGKLDASMLRDLMAKCAGGNAYIHYRLGKLALDGGYYPLAVEQFTLALKKTSNHQLTTQFLLAKAMYLAGDYAGASPLIDEILRENPKHPGALRYRTLVEGSAPP